MRFLSPKPTPLPDELDRKARGAMALFDAGHYYAAERAWAALLVECERELGAQHPESMATLDRMGSALFRQRRFEESAERHREAHRRAVEVLGPKHADTLQYAHNLGCALAMANHWAEGLEVLRSTVKLRRKTLGATHADTLDTTKTLGVSLFMAGDAQAAAELLQSAYRTAARTFGSIPRSSKTSATTSVSFCGIPRVPDETVAKRVIPAGPAAVRCIVCNFPA